MSSIRTNPTRPGRSAGGEGVELKALHQFHKGHPKGQKHVSLLKNPGAKKLESWTATGRADQLWGAPTIHCAAPSPGSVPIP